MSVHWTIPLLVIDLARRHALIDRLLDEVLEEERIDMAQNEEALLTRRIGAFVNPRMRAYAFRTVIEHALRHEMHNCLTNGSLIPQSKLDLATQIFAEATEKHVWDPLPVSPTSHERCEDEKAAAELAIASATQTLALEAERAARHITVS